MFCISIRIGAECFSHPLPSNYSLYVSVPERESKAEDSARVTNASSYYKAMEDTDSFFKKLGATLAFWKAGTRCFPNIAREVI